MVSTCARLRAKDPSHLDHTLTMLSFVEPIGGKHGFRFPYHPSTVRASGKELDDPAMGKVQITKHDCRQISGELWLPDGPPQLGQLGIQAHAGRWSSRPFRLHEAPARVPAQALDLGGRLLTLAKDHVPELVRYLSEMVLGDFAGPDVQRQLIQQRVLTSVAADGQWRVTLHFNRGMDGKREEIRLSPERALSRMGRIPPA